MGLLCGEVRGLCIMDVEPCMLNLTVSRMTGRQTQLKNDLPHSTDLHKDAVKSSRAQHKVVNRQVVIGIKKCPRALKSKLIDNETCRVHCSI